MSPEVSIITSFALFAALSLLADPVGMIKTLEDMSQGFEEPETVGEMEFNSKYSASIRSAIGMSATLPFCRLLRTDDLCSPWQALPDEPERKRSRANLEEMACHPQRLCCQCEGICHVFQLGECLSTSRKMPKHEICCPR